MLSLQKTDMSDINNREKAIINGFISSYYAYLIRMDITI